MGVLPYYFPFIRYSSWPFDISPILLNSKFCCLFHGWSTSLYWKKYNFVFIWCSPLSLVQIIISCSVMRRSSLQIGFIMNTINNHNGLHKAATITGIFLLWGALKWFRNSREMNILLMSKKIVLLFLKRWYQIFDIINYIKSKG